MKKPVVKALMVFAAVLLAALIAIQFVPVERTNPPAPAPIKAPPDVAAVLQRSCFDCHSYETKWPWYSHVAPVSWLVTKDVREGRKRLNFSAWESYPPKRLSKLARKIYSEVHEGGMPLSNYLKMHPTARLLPADVSVIEAWATELMQGSAPAGVQPGGAEGDGDASEKDGSEKD